MTRSPRIRRIAFHRFAALLSLLASGPAFAADRVNLLAIGNGALPVVSPPSYSGWSPIQLLDDAPGSGWAGIEKQTGGQRFVFELATPGTLRSVEFDTGGCLDGDRRGAKGVKVSVSTEGADRGFAPLVEATLADRADGQKFEAKASAEARWVALEIVGNHGDPSWVELCSFRGYGEASPVVPPSDLSGTYATEYLDFHVRQQGSALVGCYEHDEGLLIGAIDGRVMRITWQENGGPTDNGPAVMVFAPDGKSFRGHWWNGTDRGAAAAGTWDGQKKSDQVGSCPHWSGSVGGELERALAADGRARLYGIEFDVDSARIRPESIPVLDDVARALASHADWKLSIEGHTDSTGTAARNQTLSVERAAAVVAYLAAHGVPASRLGSSGFGAARPVADNATALGRARNRRVEIVRQ